MERLRGKVAFITGGGAGIGRAAALLFAREGAGVAIVDIDVERGRASEAAVRDSHGLAVFFQCDVTREESVAATVADAAGHFGRLDILFNCAGGSVPEDSWITDVDMAVWDRTMTLDLKGTMHCCRHAIPRIIAGGGGAVVNMSSGAALRGASHAHVYTAAKGAIVSLTRALAGAYARDNVRVNAICSGRVNTERVRATYGIPGEIRPLRTPRLRAAERRAVAGLVEDRQRATDEVRKYPFWFGEPEDIANIALFLASDESRMITGAAIPADGGRSAY